MNDVLVTIGIWFKKLSNFLIYKVIPLKKNKVKGMEIESILWKLFFLSFLICALLIKYLPSIYFFSLICLLLCYFDKVAYILAVIFDIGASIFINARKIINGLSIFIGIVILTLFIVIFSLKISSFILDGTFLNDLIFMLLSIFICFVAFLVINSIFIKYFYDKILFFCLYVSFLFLTSICVFFTLGITDTIAVYIEQYITSSDGYSLINYLQSHTFLSIKDIVSLLGYYFSAICISFSTTLKFAEKYIDNDTLRKEKANMKE